jgi:CheY-like chemotaxis protein
MPPKRTVLVVDDNDDSREVIVSYLQFLGFDTCEATNGADAVTSCELQHPDVVLMDLWMPGLIDGWEATRMIRQRSMGGSPVVIAVTAHAFAAYHEMARQAGCEEVVVKPFNLELVAKLVERVVRQGPQLAS